MFEQVSVFSHSLVCFVLLWIKELVFKGYRLKVVMEWKFNSLEMFHTILVKNWVTGPPVVGALSRPRPAVWRWWNALNRHTASQDSMASFWK